MEKNKKKFKNLSSFSWIGNYIYENYTETGPPYLIGLCIPKKVLHINSAIESVMWTRYWDKWIYENEK